MILSMRALALAFLLSYGLLGQSTAADPQDSSTFRSNTELALVRFQVKPKRGELIRDLRPEDIELLEDGIPQKVAVFEGGKVFPHKAPLEITLLFDCSGSVRGAGTLNPYIFHKNLLDEYENASIAIYAFSGNLVRIAPPTRDPETLQHAMNQVLAVPTGDTPLFEAIGETLRQSAVRPGVVRMLIVLSDGESTRPGDMSKVKPAIRVAQESGVSVSPVVLVNPGRQEIAVAETTGRPPMRNMGSNGPIDSGMPVPSRSLGQNPPAPGSVKAYLDLADATGGQKFEEIASTQVLPRVLKRIAQQMQFDYVAGYYPDRVTDLKAPHAVQVVLRTKERGTILGGTRIVIR
jgi:VWFA-related protein